MELFKYLQILKISGECVHFFMCMLLFFDIILHNKEKSMLPTSTDSVIYLGFFYFS